MARKVSKNMTKLVNQTGETIQLVPVSGNGNCSSAITLEHKKEYAIRSSPSDTNRTLELYDGKNKSTNIIITSDDLLKCREITIKKTAPPSTSNAPPLPTGFEVEKTLHEASPMECASCCEY